MPPAPSTPLRWLCALAVAFTVAGWSCAAATPFAAGKSKFLGCCYSTLQAPGFEAYWNQVSPENAGKWGSVEATRDVMNWRDLDAAYAFAKANHFPFKLHTLVWGSQQPAWIETLSPAEQLSEIDQWFAAVAVRYPDLEMIDVVNEPINAPPVGAGHGNYQQALGGPGPTGWDWVITAFRMARAYFPRSRLILNEYNVLNSPARAATYVRIISLLKDQGLIDAVGIQAHAFETTAPTATLRTNLDLIAATGVPVYITEMDVDGATDQAQLADLQRIFPLFWEHLAVRGVTLWGFRPGLWRDAQGAYLILADGAERPALTWLRGYVAASANGGPTIWEQPTSQFAALGTSTSLNAWVTGATNFQWSRNGTALPGATLATLTLASVQTGDAATYQLLATNSGGVTSSSAVTLTPYTAGLSRLANLSTRAPVGTGGDVEIAGFVITGTEPKRILLRASGPALAAFGATGVLADPVLDLYRGSTVLLTNDDWSADSGEKAAIQAAAQAAGAFPWADGSKDAALVTTLAPGSYTAIVHGKGGDTGVALVEAYELDGGATKLVNLSTRSPVGTGSNVQVAGFVVRGDGPKRVVIRASGPSLARFGLTGVLPDPVLDLYYGEQRIASNDNWQPGAKPDFQRLGLADAWSDGSKDAAIVTTLMPGNYTAIVSGKSGATGIALVEVYQLD